MLTIHMIFANKTLGISYGFTNKKAADSHTRTILDLATNTFDLNANRLIAQLTCAF